MNQIEKSKIVRAWMAENQGKHFCQCGCGGVIVILLQHHAKGIPRFLNHHAPPGDRRGEKNSRWNGGKRTRPDGYVDVYSPGHPCAYKNRVLEHRLVMETALGRYLSPDEIVHHKNEDRSDNRLENLEITNRVNHGRHHSTGKPWQGQFSPRASRAVIKQLYLRQGLTLREVAEHLGISYGSLRIHCIRFEIAIRKKDPWLKRRTKTDRLRRHSRS